MQDFKKLFLPVAIGIVVLWSCWWIAIAVLGGDRAAQGQLGDLFGGINALFSGLALAGVVTAVILQSRELQLQRTELELTRDELKKTAEANQKAADALNRQIGMQLKASELTTISSLLNSVNSQLGPGWVEGGAKPETLAKARRAYHDRLHAILNEMDKGVSLPKDATGARL